MVVDHNQTARILNIREASELVRLRPSTLYAYVSRRTIPHLKVGSRLLFDEDELRAWIDTHRVPSIPTSDERLA